MIWSGTIALHLFSWGIWVVLGLTTVVGIHALRIMLARPLPTPKPLTEADQADWPFVSLLVAAKNEEAVVGKLVKTLCNLDYPADRYELWVIDDSSTDRTPILLDQLAREYPQLKVLHRAAGAGGGKSGALNQVLPLTQGEILAVFDADAQVSQDLLKRVLALFQRPQVGAVQVRKAIANADVNFLTQGQSIEMALDAFFQEQRIALGGIGELRGNGQFVRRLALERCGGWNEETITDDLDLTFRLHLDQWNIDFLAVPAVEEEGVTRSLALWHQRNRWAEGGYQRYLDYWRFLARNRRLSPQKTFDLFVFWLIQYILPTASVPDLLMAIARNSSPLLSPLASLTLMLSFMGMFVGLRRYQQPKLAATLDAEADVDPSFWNRLSQSLQGTFYMFHWLVIVASTTARISVRPKRLKWVKTIHQGAEDEGWLDLPEQT
jgi:1,2-diacylglycerol 3-beta-glucosyltransferase